MRTMRRGEVCGRRRAGHCLVMVVASQLNLLSSWAIGAAAAAAAESTTTTMRTGSSGRRPRRVAVCVSGAVRSLTEERVRKSMESFYESGSESVDLFFHLYTGVELSARGQRNVSKASAGALGLALRTATAVRFQTSENAYTCGQMTTGKFFKVEMCAELIRGYQRRNASAKYDTLVLARPDIAFEKAPKGATVWTYDVVQSKPWFKAVGDEMYWMSFDAGLARASTMTRAKCCDVKKRWPPGCFMGKLAAPKANYISKRHFSTLRNLPYNQKPPYRIVRTDDQQLEIDGRNQWALHGAMKKDVLPVDNPTVSPPFYDWAHYNASFRQDIARLYLPDSSPVLLPASPEPPVVVPSATHRKRRTAAPPRRATKYKPPPQRLSQKKPPIPKKKPPPRKKQGKH